MNSFKQALICAFLVSLSISCVKPGQNCPTCPELPRDKKSAKKEDISKNALLRKSEAEIQNSLNELTNYFKTEFNYKAFLYLHTRNIALTKKTRKDCIKMVQMASKNIELIENKNFQDFITPLKTGLVFAKDDPELVISTLKKITSSLEKIRHKKCVDEDFEDGNFLNYDNEDMGLTEEEIKFTNEVLEQRIDLYFEGRVQGYNEYMDAVFPDADD